MNRTGHLIWYNHSMHKLLTLVCTTQCIEYSMSTTHCLSVDPFNSIICFFSRENISH